MQIEISDWTSIFSILFICPFICRNDKNPWNRPKLNHYLYTSPLFISFFLSYNSASYKANSFGQLWSELFLSLRTKYWQYFFIHSFVHSFVRPTIKILRKVEFLISRISTVQRFFSISSISSYDRRKALGVSFTTK